MNYFITTASEHIVIRVKTGEYSSALVCSFTAANALAAIVACEALNSNCLSQTKATQELESFNEAANSAFSTEYGSDAVPPYTCKNCSEVVPAGNQYCCGRCYDVDNHVVEVAPSTHSCTHCDNQVGEGIGLCHQCYMAMQPM